MATKEKETFESKLNEIETIVEKMNEGNLPLDEMIKLYEKAQKLIKENLDELNEVKSKIENIRS